MTHEYSQATEALQGLSTAEAEARLASEGLNELHASTHRRTIEIALGVAREPMFLLLIIAAVIYLILGDIREALILAFWILVIMGITIFQERKTEHALEALRDLSSPRALVIRDGEQKRIAGRDVVRDDLFILTEGDRVPADAVLLSCNDSWWTNRCLRENPFLCAKSSGMEFNRCAGRAATTYRTFTRAPCWSKAAASGRSLPPGSVPRWDESVRRWNLSKPTKPSCKKNLAILSATSLPSGYPSVPWPWFFMA